MTCCAIDFIRKGWVVEGILLIVNFLISICLSVLLYVNVLVSVDVFKLD